MSLTIYFDCFAGAAGDMIVGSLLDLGADLEQLHRDLSLLPVSGYRIAVDRIHKMHLTGAKFQVIVAD
ncbi:MAG: DUF111 family protein, partial [Deltaproteobacteria bacterium]|nr:DUF111 family protein [Deltaproteobacteria bacterium]